MKWLVMRPIAMFVVTVLTIPVYTQTAADGHEIWLWRGLSLAAAQPASSLPANQTRRPMHVNSKVIAPGAEFPKRNTCDGDDVSPQIEWTDAPGGARSLALILDDPDAPGGTFTHWLLWNVAAGTQAIAENLPKTGEVMKGARQGRNDFGKIGYGGPCPPPGKPHRYFFRLYALDAPLDLKAGANRGELERAMKGHVLAQAELVGRYGR